MMDLQLNFENIQKQIIKEINEQDYQLFLESKKNPNLVFKGYRPKNFVCEFGRFKITRRIYLNKNTKKYVYLVDKHLNLTKHTHYDHSFIKQIQKDAYVDNLSHRSIASRYPKAKLSRNVVLYQLKHKKYNPELNVKLKQTTSKQIYINLDDTFINVRNGKKN